MATPSDSRGCNTFGRHDLPDLAWYLWPGEASKSLCKGLTGLPKNPELHNPKALNMMMKCQFLQWSAGFSRIWRLPAAGLPDGPQRPGLCCCQATSHAGSIAILRHAAPGQPSQHELRNTTLLWAVLNRSASEKLGCAETTLALLVPLCARKVIGCSYSPPGEPAPSVTSAPSSRKTNVERD